MLYIEMDSKYIDTWFIQDFTEVIKKMYEKGRLELRAQLAAAREAEKLKAQAREIEKEYERAFHIGLEALGTMRGTHCSFAFDETEKIYGVVESKYHPADDRYMEDQNWVIKIHENDMGH